jgi:hypothetical protein
MHYDIPQQTNNNWQPNGVAVQNQSDQNGRNRAEQTASQRTGWQAIDTQDDGNQYRVHVRDGSGHFKTLTMDRNMNVTQEADGYC